MDQVLNSAPQFIQANQQIIKEFQPQEDQLQQQANELQDLVDQFNQQSKSLSQTQRTQQLKTIKQLEVELKTQAKQVQATLKQKNQQALAKIQTLLNQAIEQIAKQGQYDLILYQEVAYVSDSINVSQQVSQQLREWFE